MSGEDIQRLIDEVREYRRRLARVGGDDGYEPLSQAEHERMAQLGDLARELGIIETRVAIVRDLEADGEARLPEKIVRVYGLLWDMAYGPRSAQGMGDENAGLARDGVGKGRQLRVASSGEAVYRSGAVTRRDKSKRNVVRDREAFEFKRRIDARLSRMAKEVQLFLDGSRDAVVLSGTSPCSCGKMCLNEWSYCAHCGARRERGEP